MLAQGILLRVVIEVLGHSEVGTTANIYSHVMPELSRDATDRVGALLRAGCDRVAVSAAVSGPNLAYVAAISRRFISRNLATRR